LKSCRFLYDIIDKGDYFDEFIQNEFNKVKKDKEYRDIVQKIINESIKSK
jgi:hypothetical protein